MTLRTIPRVALSTYLKAVRLPLDRVVRLAGNRWGSSASLALDRAEATVRAIVGTALWDETLQDDAARRYAAADQDELALRLRAEAELRSRRADDRVAERHEEADRRRRRAGETAERKRREAQERRGSKKARTAETTARRKRIAKESAARAKDVIEKRGKHARLDHLETKAEALEEKDLAQAAAAEARRLTAAASKAKAQRKNNR